jgi:hypothetical protein
MKPPAYLLVALMLSASAIAQDSAKSAPAKDHSLAKTAVGVRVPLSDEELASVATESETCYTIRAYFFERSEDGTFQPAGMTTCVSSSPRALKKAQEKSRSEASVRLVY